MARLVTGRRLESGVMLIHVNKPVMGRGICPFERRMMASGSFVMAVRFRRCIPRALMSVFYHVDRAEIFNAPRSVRN